MAIVESLSRALANDKTGFAFDSLTAARVALASAAVAAPAASSTKTFTLPASKAALDKAVAGARSIIDTLNAIGAKIGETGSSGRSGRQVDIERLTANIDETVADAGSDDINLIGNPSTIYQMRSSSLGGSITMVSQPLDSESLGLGNLDITTEDGAAAAKAAVGDAIRTAVERFRVLSDASADLPAPASVSNALVSSLKSLVTGGLLTGATGSDARASAAGSDTIGRGALVNFRA